MNKIILLEQISNFLKGHDLLVTNEHKKNFLACSFCRSGENIFFLIRSG